MQHQYKAIKLLAGLEEQPRHFHIVVGLMLLGTIGFLDYITGSEFGVSVLYVFPIILITWFTDQRFGLIFSLAGAIVWLVAEITSTQYLSPFAPFWNSFIRLVFFIIITLLLSSLKNSLELARIDHLTSAINSRFFYEMVDIELDRFKRHPHPFTIAYIDLDNFKAVNDQFGHKIGDHILVTLVNSIKDVVRKSDFIGRLGGDEFVVFFPETDQEAAPMIISKIQSRFKEAIRQRNWSITFSAGVLTCVVAPNTTHELIDMADKLMYSAKSDDKNRVKRSTYAG